MKALKKARAELKKAEAKRDKTREQLEADELEVKKRQADVFEAENNEYVGMIRTLNVSVEQFQEIVKKMQTGTLASVLKECEGVKSDDETSDDE